MRFIDGLRRVVQEKSDATLLAGATAAATDAVMVSGRVLFDAVRADHRALPPDDRAQGHARRLQGRRSTPSTPTRTTFDVQDRPLSVTIPDGTAHHDGLRLRPDPEGVTQLQERTVADANGLASVRYRDVRDLIAAMKDTNRVGARCRTIWTSYGYDPLKRLTRITDDRNNVSRIV